MYIEENYEIGVSDILTIGETKGMDWNDFFDVLRNEEPKIKTIIQLSEEIFWVNKKTYKSEFKNKVLKEILHQLFEDNPKINEFKVNLMD